MFLFQPAIPNMQSLSVSDINTKVRLRKLFSQEIKEYNTFDSHENEKIEIIKLV